jgi:hypothetical protein
MTHYVTDVAVFFFQDFFSYIIIHKVWFIDYHRLMHSPLFYTQNISVLWLQFSDTLAEFVALLFSLNCLSNPQQKPDQTSIFKEKVAIDAGRLKCRR